MKGSVRKRGEIWYYRINLGVINNKRKEIERAVGKSEKDAYKAMRQAMVELDQSGQYFEPSCKAFSDYLDEWIESYELNLKEYSIIKYKSIIEKHLKPSLGKYKLKSLSPALIQKFIDDKKRSGYSKNTTTLIFAVLRKSLRHAIHPFNYIKNNPAENIQLPKFDIRKKVTSFTPEQMQIIFKRFDSSHLFYIPIMIAYYTGMRLGECLALQWKNIDINSRKIAIDSTLYDKEKDKIRIVKAKTQTSIREIDFTDKLLNILKLQKKQRLITKTTIATCSTVTWQST